MKKITLKILSFIPFLIIFVFSIYIISTSSPLPGGIRLFSVMSGSMQPTIKVGSIIIVKQQKDYKKNDIITFTLLGSRNKVTHRITKAEIKDKLIFYRVKGDANNTEDPTPVLKSDVIGKVIFVIPYLGHFFRFINTLHGLIIVIALGTLVIYTELIEIKNELIRIIKERKIKKQNITKNITTKIKKFNKKND